MDMNKNFRLNFKISALLGAVIFLIIVIYLLIFTNHYQKYEYEIIGQAIDDKFIGHVMAQVVNQDAIDKMQKDIRIVYTPLHGVGGLLLPQLLRSQGFTNLHCVEAQMAPDGNFPTAPAPNPEHPPAFALALELARQIRADLVVATDPDADRVAFAALRQGEYQILSGLTENDYIAFPMEGLYEGIITVTDQEEVDYSSGLYNQEGTEYMDEFGTEMLDENWDGTEMMFDGDSVNMDEFGTEQMYPVDITDFGNGGEDGSDTEEVSE